MKVIGILPSTTSALTATTTTATTTTPPPNATYVANPVLQNQLTSPDVSWMDQPSFLGISNGAMLASGLGIAAVITVIALKS